MATLQGTSVVFGTYTWAETIVSVGGHTASRDAVDDTGIADTSVQKIPSLIVDYGTTEISYLFNQSSSKLVPIEQVAETITITYPLLTGEGTAATLAGSGFVSDHKYPDAETKPSDSARGSITVTWASKPTHTAGSV